MTRTILPLLNGLILVAIFFALMGIQVQCNGAGAQRITLYDLQRQLNALEPEGAVQAFNLTTCPPGWTPLTDAVGRVVVGGGTLGLTVPENALPDGETNRLKRVPNHVHLMRIGPDMTNPHGLEVPPDGRRFTDISTPLPEQIYGCPLNNTVLHGYVDPPAGFFGPPMQFSHATREAM